MCDLSAKKKLEYYEYAVNLSNGVLEHVAVYFDKTNMPELASSMRLAINSSKQYVRTAMET